MDSMLLERATSIVESFNLLAFSNLGSPPLVAVAESGGGGTSQLLDWGSLFRCGHGQFLQSIL